MDWLSVLKDMVVSAEGLSLLGIMYVLFWLTGRIPNLFSPKKWDWLRGLEDFCKLLLMSGVIIAIIGVANVGTQFWARLGFDITEGMAEASSYVLMAAMGGGFVYYGKKAAVNAWSWFKLSKSNRIEGDKEQFEKGKDKIWDDTRAAIEFIVTKTDKQHILDEAEGEVPVNVLNDLEISLEDAGRGGIVNTYPNTPKPYRTEPIDTITDPSSCWNRECVSYIAWKIYELTGKWPTRTGGMDAKYWVERLAENGYKTVVSRPQPGGRYVGVMQNIGKYGHVVWWEGDQTVSEYNYSTRGGFGVRSIDLSAYKWVQIQAPSTVIPVAPATPDKVTKKEVTYTYKVGDTFGQVITDLGLKTSHGLWGDDGDVAYYTEQLHAQGIWGNVPVGTSIKLSPRS